MASTIYEDEFRRHGATGSRRRTRDDEHAQDSGTVWCHGGVDARPRKIIALISPEDGYAEDGGGIDFSSVCAGTR